MRSHHLFLLIYLTALCCFWGISDAQRNETCHTQELCTQAGDPTSNFLQCVGLPATDTGRDHLQNLKDTIDAALDVYSFMRSSLSQTPVLGLELGISVNPEAEAYQDEDLIKVWMEVKLKPLLSSISRGFLTCLSNKNFSCNTYQTMVEELSDHFSEMDPVRQRWIYMFFMYPFLSGERAGCVRPGENSEDWLIRNFGSFKAVARMRDFTALNMVFSGLEVLHLLTLEQKAELLLHPEVEGLENGTLSLVFHTLMTEVHPPMENSTWTTPGYPSPIYPPSYTPAYPPRPTSDDQYSPRPPSPQESLREVVNGFMGVFRPFGSFVREFVSLTHKKPLSEIRSTTLTQVVLNWTLAELAGNYRSQEDEPEDWMEDILDVEDWYDHVVVPVLRRVLPHDQTHIPGSLKAVFYKVFYLNSDMDSMDNDTMPLDICSITLEERSCGLTNAVEKVARVLHCVARSNLTMSEETIMRLVVELTGRLNSLVQKFSTANFSEVAHHFQEVFGQADSPALTQENLNDPDFIRLWFQIKLKPLLPSVPPSLLSCLSTKNFTCPVYQALVGELSEQMKLMDQEDEQMYEMHGHMIYKQFLLPFLLNHNSSDPQCISSASSSADWLIKNFGGFSAFAPLRDFYDLNGNFSALSALEVLSPKQTAELVVLPLPGLPGKAVIINTVFDYLTESPKERKLPEFLYHLIRLSAEITMPCKSYKIIFERLYQALSSVPPEMEPVVWANIDNLMQTAPAGCGLDEQCPSTPFNYTRVCAGVNSYPLQHHLHMGNMTEVLCKFSLEQYACSQLKDFPAEHLVSLLKCKLPGNSSHSKETWKVLLTKLTSVLDQALDMFSNMSKPVIGPALSQVLDVIGEIRVNRLTEDQLRDSDVIRKWFSGRLRLFLPSASGGFLHCLSTKNLSCDTYQQILKEFSNQFDQMDQMRQELVVKYFIQPFLTKNSSDSGCVSNSNSSVDWLQKNLGPFSVLVSLRDLLEFNTDFSPLSVLEVLSPKQTAELVVLPLPGLPGKDVIINTVFDYLSKSPKERKLPEFLYHLSRLSVVTPVGCPVYQTIFVRLYQAMSALPQEMEPIIWASVYDLTESAPMDCALVPVNQQCPVSSHNATRVCASVDSSSLQQLLDSEISTGRLCDFSIKQYACSQLKDLTAENLVTLLKCKLSENNTYSKETWKLFFTKASAVLDQALVLLSNQSEPVIGPALSQVLDVIGEIRVNILTEDQLRDSVVIRKLFSGHLRPFLPTASEGFLHCLSTKNLSCDSYQAVVKEFGAQFDHMTLEQQQLVLKELVIPFLSRPTTDSGCVSNSNSSVDWLQKNLGPFSVLVSLRDLLEFNTDFSPLSVLEVLSPKQTAELVVLPLPGLPGKAVIINTVFDYLSKSPKERKLPEFLYYLVRLSEEMMLPCDSFKTIFERLYQALPSVPPEMEPVIQAIIDNLMQTAPADCLPMNMKCPITPANDSRVCEGNASDSLQSYLATSNTANVPCNFSLEEYACASLTNFTAEHLVSLLKCKLPGNSSHSKETWKVLLTKLTSVLDQALDMFSNMSKPVIGPAASQALDVIGEIRVNRLTEDQLRDSDVIRKWFSGRLRLFLPSASGGFLHCLSTKNLSCDTYQQILREFSNQFDQMDQMRQELVVKYFIQPFLTKNSSDSGCVSNSNSSVDWLQKNLGRFSVLLSLSDLLKLNTDFSPLSVLEVLSPKQTAELVVLPLPGLPGKAVIINTVFDYLSKSPKERKLPEFLYYLVRLSEEMMLPCDSFKTIFERLYQALPSVPPEMEPVIQAIIDNLMQTAPADCLPMNMKCPITPANDSRVCEGNASDSLQSYLATSNTANVPCNFSLEEYACASLTNFTAEHLVSLLKCKLPGNSSHSKETWKVLLTKLTSVLDQALDMFSNMSKPVIGPAVSQALDVIGEIRVNRLTEDQLRDSDVIRKWFSGRLRLFLPSASGGFLHCLSTKNLSCDTYQQILREFSNQFDQMDQMRQELVVKYFIQPFLTKNSSDSGCVSNSNSSVDWLQKNLGRFSVLLSLSDLLKLNTDFSPLSVLEVLSPKQTAELVVLPLPGLPGKDVIINTVFDYLSKSPRERKLPEFLYHLSRLSVVTPVGCPVYQTIFVRLYQAMSALPQEMEPIIWASVYDLTESAPMDCALVPVNQQCPVSSHNATRVCASVDSSSLQQLLDSEISTGRLCDFSIKQYACSQLKDLTAENLVTLLKCKLSENNTYSKETWKLFFTKASAVLDQALVLLSNQSEPVIGPALSQVLDVIGEIRVNRLTEDQLRDSVVIRKLFSGHLRPFLPTASEGFLHCLSTKNLSCDSYQAVVKEFGAQFDHMTLEQQQLVLKELVIPFLSRPTTDSGCVSNSNSSVDWLQKNLGPFSVLVSLRDLLEFNTDFSPLSVLEVLSPKQTAELVVLPLPGPPEKAVIINTVFDYLTESPKERRLPEFLQQLVNLTKQENIPCASYKIIFTRLDEAVPTVTMEIESAFTSSKTALLQTVPSGCIVYSGECNVTPVNETKVCAGVDSTALQGHLDNGQISGVLCDFNVDVYACGSLSVLTSDNLVSLLKCKLSGNTSHSAQIWKLFFSKVSVVLDSALDLFSNTTLDPSCPAVSQALDAIREVRLDSFSLASLRDQKIINLWFNTRLRPFLPAVSTDFLSCLSTKNFSCSTYQTIVQILSSHHSAMDQSRQISVYTTFIEVFLSRNNTADPSCSSDTLNSGDWLLKNFRGFSAFASFKDMQRLLTTFSVMEALPQLTVRQLAEVSSSPDQLSSAADVTMLMNYVPNILFTDFFNDFSLAITGQESKFPVAVRSAMLQQVFERGNLSDRSVSDQEVLTWLQSRLRPLLINLSPLHVAPLFSVVAQRNCNIGQQLVEVLNATLPTLQDNTQRNIYDQITLSLQGSSPLRCYGANYNHSFYGYLESSFLSFGFPNLTTFLSLIPHSQMEQLVNSLPVSDLGRFLRRPNVVDDDTKLCQLYSNYAKTPLFLGTESIPGSVRRPTLPCVWPQALSSSQRSEVNAWFDLRLKNYLPFLTRSLVTSAAVKTAPCLAFQKLISILGSYNYSAADFVERDVYRETIKTYLTSASVPKCYNASDPELNSTAWFAENIGLFITYLTLEDLNTFGSAQVLQVFTVNLVNIGLLNYTSLPQNLTDYYTSLVYLQDSNFNPLFLPLLFRCVAPGPAFRQLDAEQSMILLHNLTTLCTNLDPQVSAALAANMGDNINSNTIAALGRESTGLSEGQITMAPASVLWASFSILSTVIGWNQGQAMAIIQSLMLSGTVKINNASTLTALGSLVTGVPSATLGSISGTELLYASQNPTFITYMQTAPTILIQTFVTQLITVNPNPDSILQNVPDSMATEIPRSLLQGFSQSSVEKLNQKTWRHEQAVLFFDTVALGIDNSDNMSSSVLQGFTCTRVASMTTTKIKNLVKACRRKGNNRVALRETQLTCMYNYIKEGSDVTSYNLYPPDMLLYYDYSKVSQDTCKDYFRELGDADFSVFSNALSFKRTALVNNAKTCLGIIGTVLSSDNLQVLGNMVCVLDGSYIQNSDQLILQKLQNCNDLTDEQVAAIETLLTSGKTQYGLPATWNRETLDNLGILPLYLTSSFYRNFSKKVKGQFLQSFLKVLRKNGTSRQKKRRMKTAIRQSIIEKSQSKRSIVSECTVGNITQVTISESTFPFNYETVTKFNCCLTAKTVVDNLEAITAKVDDQEYLEVVLARLREFYSANSTIPEAKVQVLGPASRVATNADITMWNITKIDTLSALMDSSYGNWDAAMAQTIISKYLRNSGNTLGSAELNSIGGPNLCSLDISLLKIITQSSLSKANALTVTNCNITKKRTLFIIAEGAFQSRSTVSATSYQLTQPYIGGADSAYVQRLSTSNINMDMDTFISLDPTVIQTLGVSQVKGLLGSNLPELKSYENQSVVQTWISTRFQADLDSLGLDLKGGKADPTTVGVGNIILPITSAGVAGGAGPVTTVAGGAATTASGGAINRPTFGLHLLLTTLAIAVLYLLH
ncbi:uncharacterized protein mslnb isoform X4 [Salmo trutta]|uniref:uncharacterized protein mslnb isoform X4 n=1 Tax=Salmo trutta TaxID=8032 RepID=UPI0011305D84|nr:uncharacterized protein LOC115178798 isoform X4 [Salmo trutta]